MLEQIRILLDAARYRLSQIDEYGDGYWQYQKAQGIVDALERAESEAEALEGAQRAVAP